MEKCELCGIDKATTTIETRNFVYKTCGRCKALSELEEDFDDE